MRNIAEQTGNPEAAIIEKGEQLVQVYLEGDPLAAKLAEQELGQLMAAYPDVFSARLAVIGAAVEQSITANVQAGYGDISIF